jgi:cytochrome b561
MGPITTAMTIMAAAVAAAAVAMTDPLRAGDEPVTVTRRNAGPDEAGRRVRTALRRSARLSPTAFIQPFMPRATTMPSPSRAGYSLIQILLHWVTVLMVVFQLAFGESMGEVAEAIREGGAIEPAERLLADAHYWIGLAILAATLLRVIARVMQGSPGPAPAAPAWTHTAASITHGLFYVLLLAMPVTGLLAVYVSEFFGELHEVGKPIFILLILLHVGAVAVHQLTWGDGVLRRMMTPGR